MSVLLYGGGFNPPHLGHLAALQLAVEALQPDRVFLIPDGTPPHKPLPPETPSAEERLALVHLAFRELPEAQVQELALRREGVCYMADTLPARRERYPGEDWILLLGADMLLCLDQWHKAEEILRSCTVAALCRRDGEREALSQKAEELRSRFGATIVLLEHEPLPISSSQIRSLLPLREGRELLDGEVYREIIRRRLYGAKPELRWLREQVYAMLKPKRIPHVAGCEEMACHLAKRWGLDPDTAAEAGILHDMTKYWSDKEQLAYCRQKGIRLDEAERANPLLYHARTGAVAAWELFGASNEICEAIRWHTTGKPGMNELEKILYLADKIEKTRDYPGVERIRALAERDLDAAMAESLRGTVENIRERHLDVYHDTLEAYDYFASRADDNKEE